MNKEEHNCDNVNCNHNNTKGLCCLFNPDNCKYRQLQKENERLTVSYETLKLHDEEEIGMLKSENAELKDDNKVMADNYSKMEQKFYDNLTKAKELLERLLITSCNSDVLNLLPNCSEVLRVRVEAEQFLNSEVEK